MKQFKVRGAEITKSRGLSYVYKYTDCFEADTAEAAAALFKEKHKAPSGHRWTVRIDSVKESV